MRISIAMQQRRSFRAARPILWCSSVLLTLSATSSPVVPAEKLDDVVAHVSVSRAKEDVLQSTTTGFGKVQSRPADVVSIDAPHDSIVNKVYVRAGETVKQGSPLAGLTAAATAQEAYRKAQTAADYANAELKRMELLWSKRVIALQTLEQAQSAARDAQASLQAQKKIGAQKQEETLNAPISGTVTSVSVSEGDRIQQNAKILSLSPGNALAVLLGVEPDESGAVQRGMSVILSPATAPTVKIAGRVSAINAVIDPLTRLVDVLVDIESGSGDPQPIGTYMRGEIILKRGQALTVPRAAILYDKRGAYVFVVRNRRAHRLAVTPGLEGGDQVAVKGDIKPGDSVVVQGNYELTDGMKVDEVAHEVP